MTNSLLKINYYNCQILGIFDVIVTQNISKIEKFCQKYYKGQNLKV